MVTLGFGTAGFTGGGNGTSTLGRVPGEVGVFTGFCAAGFGKARGDTTSGCALGDTAALTGSLTPSILAPQIVQNLEDTVTLQTVQ